MACATMPGMRAQPPVRVTAQVIVLNGGSSSGKSTIARCLQEILPAPWLRLSVDDLAEALPPSLTGQDAGLAASQSELVHRNVRYDLEVDTSQAGSLDCARVIAARVA